MIDSAADVFQPFFRLVVHSKAPWSIIKMLQKCMYFLFNSQRNRQVYSLFEESLFFTQNALRGLYPVNFKLIFLSVKPAIIKILIS